MPISKATASSIAPAAKGDLVVGSATNDAAVLGVGSNDQVLTADSSTATGLKWAAAAGGAGNMVQIATGTLSGSSLTISGLSTYTDLLFIVYGARNNTSDGLPYFRINNDSTATVYQWAGGYIAQANNNQFLNNGNDLQLINGGNPVDRTNNEQAYSVRFFNCKNPGFTTYDIQTFAATTNAYNLTWIKGIYKVSATMSSLVFANYGGTWAAGTYVLWGA